MSSIIVSARSSQSAPAWPAAIWSAPLKFSLKSFLTHSILITVAFGIAFDHSHSLGSYIIISALYSAAFAVPHAQRCVLKGILGAALGLAIALVFGIGSDFYLDLVDESNPPLFDGDGPFHGLVYLPLMAFFYLLIPAAIMGSGIGCLCFFIRNRIALSPGTTN